MISEVVALRVNEEVASQLHSRAISLLDEQHTCINMLEEQVEDLNRVNTELRTSVVSLAKELSDVRLQSVMCHVILMHYVETHWEPMGHLLAQIRSLASCGTTPFTRDCSCDVIDEPFNSQGEDGPETPSSLSLESQSPSLVSGPFPSPITSVYYSAPFLSPVSTTLPPFYHQCLLLHPLFIISVSLVTSRDNRRLLTGGKGTPK